jgi:hypothetical protein
MLAGMNVDQIAAAKALYGKSGYSPDAIATAFAAVLPGGTPARTPMQSAGDGSTWVHAAGAEGLTPEQRLAGYQNVLKHSSDPASVIAAAKADGIALALPNGATAEPTGGSDWRLQYPHADELENIGQFDSSMKSMLANVPGMNQSEAQRLASALTESLHTFDPDDEVAIQRMKDETARVIGGMSGSADILKYQEIAVNKLKETNPAFYQSLADQGAFLSSSSVVALANLGRRLAARTNK